MSVEQDLKNVYMKSFCLWTDYTVKHIAKTSTCDKSLRVRTIAIILFLQYILHCIFKRRKFYLSCNMLIIFVYCVILYFLRFFLECCRFIGDLFKLF